MNEREIRAALDAPACCLDCGVQVEAITVLRKALTDANRELSVKRAQITSMRAEQSDRRSNAHYDDACEIFEFWRTHLSPKAREFSDERFVKVVARLNAGHPKTIFKKAILGLKGRPYVKAGKRVPQGKPSERHADLELICRSEAHLERFAALYDETRPQDPAAGLDVPLGAWQQALTPDLAGRLKELRGWELHALRELGVGYHDNRLVFPVTSAAGKLVGLARYAPNPERRTGPKLLAEGPRELFPPPERVQSSIVWLVEGEPDAVAARSAHLPAVAVPGVGKWQDEWAERFRNFSCVYVAFDCDEAGRNAAAARAASIGKVTTCKVLDLGGEDGYDVGDMLLELGAKATQERLIELTRDPRAAAVIPFSRRSTSEAPYDAVLSALERSDCKVRPGDGRAEAQCPVHEDRHASMSVTEGGDGRVLMHCHAGCDPEAILGALGLTWSDAFAEEAQ